MKLLWNCCPQLRNVCIMVESTTAGKFGFCISVSKEVIENLLAAFLRLGGLG